MVIHLTKPLDKGRVSVFSDGQAVLGHVVGWLKKAVEKGEWEGNIIFLYKNNHDILCHIKITFTKDKSRNHLGLLVVVLVYMNEFPDHYGNKTTGKKIHLL